MRLIGAAAAVSFLFACTQAHEPQKAAVAPTNSASEHVQLQLGNVQAFKNVTLDAETEPAGYSDKLASPLASLTFALLKFCPSPEGPIQGVFTLEHGRKNDLGSSSSPSFARCFQRNLDDAKFPEIPAAIHVQFRISGEGSLAKR